MKWHNPSTNPNDHSTQLMSGLFMHWWKRFVWNIQLQNIWAKLSDSKLFADDTSLFPDVQNVKSIPTDLNIKIWKYICQITETKYRCDLFWIRYDLTMLTAEDKLFLFMRHSWHIKTQGLLKLVSISLLSQNFDFNIHTAHKNLNFVLFELCASFTWVFEKSHFLPFEACCF